MSAYTASASAWRPLRYRATIRSSRSRSRSGCAAVSAVSSETASAWQPTSRSRSRRVSVSWSRHSSRRVRWFSAYGPGTEASASPSHSPSALLRSVRACERSPEARALSASAASSWATVTSNASWPTRIAYPCGIAGQRLRVEHLAQPGGVRTYRGERLGGRFVAPDRVDELRGGGRAATTQQECRQQGALLGRTGRQRFAVPPCPYRTEYGETQIDAARRPLLWSALLRNTHVWPDVTVHCRPLPCSPRLCCPSCLMLPAWIARPCAVRGGGIRIGRYRWYRAQQSALSWVARQQWVTLCTSPRQRLPNGVRSG